MEYIQKFDSSWDKRKAGIVKHTIWTLLVHPDTRRPIDKLFITKNKVRELTKTPMTVINELIKDNVLLKTDNEETFLVNQKRVYCQLCEYYQQKDRYTQNRDLGEDKSFFQWEINDHLRNIHSYGKYEHNPITQEVIDRYILENKPTFKLQDHKLKIKEIDQSQKDRIYVKLVCEICQEDFTTIMNIDPCSNYKEIVKTIN